MLPVTEGGTSVAGALALVPRLSLWSSAGFSLPGMGVSRGWLALAVVAG